MDLQKNTAKLDQYKARARALVAQMSLEEKVFQMLYEAPAIPRLGVRFVQGMQGHDPDYLKTAACDVVIACLGLDPGLEGEEGDEGNEFASGDRESIDLPGLQEELLKTICASGKPVVLVLQSGSALAVNWAAEHVPAILQCWYPGAQGGRAVAETIFGECSPEGKLPMTFYRTLDDLPPFTDYAMKGRTYRYMTAEALYPFGYGLSYSTFSVTGAAASADRITEEGLQVTCTVKNTGTVPAGTAVQVYVKAERPGTPNAQLKGLKKVFLDPGAETRVTVALPAAAFALCDGEGVRRVESGDHSVYVGLSQPDRRSCELMGCQPARLRVTCRRPMTLEERPMAIKQGGKRDV